MATWNGVITNAGNSLLNEWVNEKALNFDSAAAGQGLSLIHIFAQTADHSHAQKPPNTKPSPLNTGRYRQRTRSFTFGIQ